MEPKLFMELFAEEYVELLAECWPAHITIKDELKKITLHSARIKGTMGTGYLASYLKFYGRSFNYWRDRIEKIQEGPLGLYFDDNGEISIDIPKNTLSGPILDKLIFECASKSSEQTKIPIEKFVTMYQLQAELVRKERIIKGGVSEFANIGTRLFGQSQYTDMFNAIRDNPDKVLKVTLIFRAGSPKISSWKVI